MTILRLNHIDYIDILKYYNVDHSTMNKNDIKQKAENLISSKLCRCIKKVTKNGNEQPAVAICTNSILTSRGLKYYGFSCKGKYELAPYHSKNKHKKTRSDVRLSKKERGRLKYPERKTTRKKAAATKKPTINKTKRK